MPANVFSNSDFFTRYMELRKELNYNDLLEHPEMEKLLPPLIGRSVLDLGCGYGAYAREFIEKGASSYLGLDSSELMIAKAEKENSGKNISYRKLDLGHLEELEGKYDLAYSSLVFHYIEDFDRLVRNINMKLNDGGILLFSQMHPLISASYGYSGYFESDYFAFTGYQDEGRREGKWFKQKVISYHRKVSSIISTLSFNGFFVEKVVEPVPNEDLLMEFASLERDLIRPTFLIVRARKVPFSAH